MILSSAFLSMEEIKLFRDIHPLSCQGLTFLPGHVDLVSTNLQRKGKGLKAGTRGLRLLEQTMRLHTDGGCGDSGGLPSSPLRSLGCQVSVL